MSEGLQLRLADRSEHRTDLAVDVSPIVVRRRVGSSEPGDVLHPTLEQVGERHVVERDFAGGDGHFEFG